MRATRKNSFSGDLPSGKKNVFFFILLDMYLTMIVYRRNVNVDVTGAEETSGVNGSSIKQNLTPKGKLIFAL